jgi:hypothetical protein
VRKRKASFSLPEPPYKRHRPDDQGLIPWQEYLENLKKRAREFEEDTRPTKRPRLEDASEEDRVVKREVERRRQRLDEKVPPNDATEKARVFSKGNNGSTPVKRRSSKKKTNKTSSKSRRKSEKMPRKNNTHRGYHTRRELKNLDLAIAEISQVTNLDTASEIVLLNGCAQGTAVNQRIGRKAIMRSVRVHGHVRPFDASTAPHQVEIFIVLDRQVNGSAPNKVNIWNGTSAMAFPNLDNSYRFKILRRQQFFIGTGDTGAAAGKSLAPGGKAFDLYVKFGKRGLMTHYAGTGSGVDDIRSGALYFIVKSSAGTAANSSTVSYSARVRFTEF